MTSSSPGWFALIVVSLLLQPLRGQSEALTDTTERMPNPRTALYLSLIPGGGQLYNRAWLKALFFIAAEGYYIQQFQYYRDQQDRQERNKRAWWIAFIYIMGMMDAFVDAHLKAFPPDSSAIAPEPSALPQEKSP